MRLFRKRKGGELAPDEIFLDASNLPDFDHARLEGRLEKPLSKGNHTVLSVSAFLLLAMLFVKAFFLGVVDGHAYKEQSERNRLRPEVIFAERGAVTDRNGIVLISNVPGEDGFPLREYRHPGFAHLLGYVSYPKKDSKGNYYETEIEGVGGIEAAFDNRLRGENGTLLVEENALGEEASKGTVVPASNGETLILSIDARAQEAFAAAIEEVAELADYQGGAGVLLDVGTGEVHALASYPEYNPNILSRGTPSEVIQGYLDDTRRPYLDRAVSGLYTPGSIIKPLIAAGAYADGIISPETEIVSTGALTIPNPYDPENPTIFRDWKAHGATDMREAIAVSSDVYFYTIGGGFEGQKGLGIERLAYWYRAFGLESVTGIELPGEVTGFVPTPKWKKETFDEEWRIGNTYHTSIGQYAMQITALEAVRAIAAIANGGKLVSPSVLKGGTLGGETVAISPQALAIAREGMRLGVTEGTSAAFNAYSFVEVAAKTGTAELGFENEYRNSWIVGFFPYESPKYAFALVMEKGHAGNTTGGVFAMSRVFEALHQSAPEYFNGGI